MVSLQHVAVFLADEPTLRRLRAAFSGQCLVEAYPATIESIQSHIDRGEVLAAVVDLRRGTSARPSTAPGLWSLSPDGDRAIAFVTALHARYATLPIVGYVDFTPQQAREILWAAHAGVQEIILREFDDLEFVTRRVLGLGRIGEIRARTFAAISELVPDNLREFFTACLSHAHEGLTMDGAAAAVRASKKTIAVRLRRRSLPPPYRIIGWGRVLAASRWLEEASRPIEQVARELHFAGGTGLRNFLRRYVGCRAEELREHGGFDYALRLFVQELREPWASEPKTREHAE